LHGYVAVPSGDDNFTISLTAPPVHRLGDVVVKFNTVSLGCANCIALRSASGVGLTKLTFTSENWNIPQRVFIHYLKSGDSYFQPYATGGGYEIKNWESGAREERTLGSSMHAVTCLKGIPGFGCE